MSIRVCILCLLSICAAAQVDSGAVVPRLRVHLNFLNGTCEPNTHVEVMGRNGRVAEGITDDQCVVEFQNVPEGAYQLDVTGQNIAQTDAGRIDASTASSDFEVNVNRAGNSASRGNASGSSVSVANLRVPSKAKKEFDKGNGLLQHQDFARAIEKLNQAVADYPAYANAYNTLGVIYGRLGDHLHEREALQRAVTIDDHFAAAFTNIGRMEITAKNFPNAEAALSKSSDLDPTDAMTLVLLSFSQFMDRHLDEAIASAKRAHSLNGVHAYAHQIAARAYEQKRNASDAIAQLQLFLKEEPTGSRADAAHKELKDLQAIRHSFSAGGSAQ
jgi:tetratricopeptide (TPR) repeat protein